MVKCEDFIKTVGYIKPQYAIVLETCEGSKYYYSKERDLFVSDKEEATLYPKNADISLALNSLTRQKFVIKKQKMILPRIPLKMQGKKSITKGT